MKLLKRMKKKKINRLSIIALSLAFCSVSFICRAKMESESFKINADVVGIGGDLGSSENYVLTDTVGETVIGLSDSENYGAQQGFWQMMGTGISLTIDSNTFDLGLVNPTNSAEGQSVLSVITDAWGGYDLYINENHPLLHNDAVTEIEDISCEISAPCLWSGYGFGFTVKDGTGVDGKWGSSPNYKYAKAPLTATNFHDKIGYKSGIDETTVGYKVAPNSTQKSGVYSNIIVYTAIAKL
jgi:hypothetical protein